MKESIVLNRADGSQQEFVGGKDFVEAVAKAASKQELADILHAGGVSGFSEEMLEESWRSLALSQNWDAIQEIFEDTDFESRGKKLAAHGIQITREDHDRINALIATGSDDALIAELRKAGTIENTMQILHRHGYYAITADFLLLVRENSTHLYEDALLTPQEIEALSGHSFYERCRKSVNLIFALSTIAGLALGISNMADPAMLLAIASGISLIYGKNDDR